ncbi:hypothetical protein J4407_02990 [Candidatus Pacearchaeota archaeon]|nr:hypothetical protein [Candidatus Pacearchaeota archaeon]
MERIKKENKEKIMEMLRKAGSEEYEISWDDAGIPYKQKKKTEIKRGKKSRAKGAKFELRVRKDLESKGRIVDKWSNNVDLEKEEMFPAKRNYNPFFKVMTIGTGFPDFISIKHIHDGLYSVIGVEVKTNGILSKTEKEKCAWYLKNEIFSEIWIAKAFKNGKKIEVGYDNFSEKYGQKYNKA